jgi:hypothetical protein
MVDGVIGRWVAMVVSLVHCVFSVGEYCVRGVWAHQQGGWAVRGLGDRRTDHFAPLVHAPKKTISKSNVGF